MPDTKLEKYQDIQAMVQKEIRTMFPDLYKQYGTQYGVNKTPTHSHNGIDSVPVQEVNLVQNNKNLSGFAVDTSGTYVLIGLNLTNIKRLVFYGFAANNAVTSIVANGDFPTGNKTVTGAFSGGENSATLTGAWTGTTGIFQTTFSNGNVRNATYTHGSTGITWSGVLTGAATATIHIDGAAGTFVLASNWTGASGVWIGTFSNGDVRNITLTNGSAAGFFSGAILTGSATDTITLTATKRAIINGEAAFGRCFKFNGEGVGTIQVTTTPAGSPIIQISNYMYMDALTLTKNRVGITDELATARDDTGTTVASLKLDSYTEQSLTITVVLASGWKLQSNIIIT